MVSIRISAGWVRYVEFRKIKEARIGDNAFCIMVDCPNDNIFCITAYPLQIRVVKIGRLQVIA